MTADRLMNNLDSYIFKVRARTNPPRDPDVLSVFMRDYSLLEAWASKHPLQTKLVVDPSGGMTFRGIKLKVK